MLTVLLLDFWFGLYVPVNASLLVYSYGVCVESLCILMSLVTVHTVEYRVVQIGNGRP